MKNIYSKNQISISKTDCFTASAVKVLEKVLFFFKKNQGRVIIEYSPVTQQIQSPSAVISEIKSTLQFWQGKPLHLSLDLKYAYLGHGID